jgi:hypothetical protein
MPTEIVHHLMYGSREKKWAVHSDGTDKALGIERAQHVTPRLAKGFSKSHRSSRGSGLSKRTV